MSVPLFAIEVDASSLLRLLERAREELAPAARQSLGQSVSLAVRNARGSRAFEDRTGELRKSIRPVQSGPWSFAMRAGGPKARYALFVEGGTKAHPITPKATNKSGLLRFRGLDGGWVSKRIVQHPGTLPAHFMRDASRGANVALLDMLERAAERIFHG
jgi:hypothetical protein